MDVIAKPFGWLMMVLYEFTGNYGVAVILFALIVKIILCPFQAKSKKSSLEMTRLQPKLKELEKKHGANKQKYNEEMQKLYKAEHINPMSGCIWSLIPFPILIALYLAIRKPLTVMMGIGSDLLKEGGAILAKLTELGFSTTTNAAYIEIGQAQFISANIDKFRAIPEIAEKFKPIDYSFLGLDLGSMPQIKFLWDGSASEPSQFVPLFGLLFIPLLCCVLTYLSMKISTAMTGQTAQQGMGAMTVMMPLMTLYFAFIMPAALGVYWIASSLFSIIQDIILNKIYMRQFKEQDAQRDALEKQKEAELEAKRQETERLKAENRTEVNPNTSKRKQQTKTREEQKAKATEWERLHSPEPVNEEAGREGTRRYAHGRAYRPDRYGDSPAEETISEDAVEPADAEIAGTDENYTQLPQTQADAKTAPSDETELDDDDEEFDDDELEDDEETSEDNDEGASE